MKAWELERSSVFSVDGGETWYVVLSDPRDGDNDTTVFLAAPVGSPRLSMSKEFVLDSSEHVWEPNQDDLDSGSNKLRVKESRNKRFIRLTGLQLRKLVESVVNESRSSQVYAKNPRIRSGRF